jgi:hypothetical protein
MEVTTSPPAIPTQSDSEKHDMPKKLCAPATVAAVHVPPSGSVEVSTWLSGLALSPATQRDEDGHVMVRPLLASTFSGGDQESGEEAAAGVAHAPMHNPAAMVTSVLTQRDRISVRREARCTTPVPIQLTPSRLLTGRVPEAGPHHGSRGA